ncbi:hypothetical protein RKD49_000877 [Streptomyces glaucescens]
MVFKRLLSSLGVGGPTVDTVLDKRGGFLISGHDALTHFTVGHHDARDWNTEVDGWIRQLVGHRAAYGVHGDPYVGHGHGHDDRDDHHRPGPGMGTAVAAGAAGLAVGVAGGMLAAEVVDEVGDFFEGDEDEG